MANDSLYNRFPEVKVEVQVPDPRVFINRELSLLEFNDRVFQQGMDPNTPLLERLRFFAIVLSNLDEFFMVRVARLKSCIEAKESSDCPTGMSYREQFQRVSEAAHVLVEKVYSGFRSLTQQLRHAGIRIQQLKSLTPPQRQFVLEKFESEVFPVLTPLAVDPAHPFPLLLNLSLNLLVRLRSLQREGLLALVQVPATLPRLLELPCRRGKQFVLLEEVIAANVDELFRGHEILETGIFRITRDADLELDDEGPEDFIHAVEEELRKRRINEPVRLEVRSSLGTQLTKTLQRHLGLSRADVYRIRGPLDLRGLTSLCDLQDFESLKYSPLPPVILPQLVEQTDLFAVVAARDLLFHHPYDSYESIVDLVLQAGSDPDVLAIKQTFYRTNENSPIARALEAAALSGKQVTVLVELTARFDEERNITWARQLERAGAHVIYGLAGLKTHGKILLVVRREADGIRRYVHLSTGNYNDRTARQYTDIGLLTARHDMGADASGFFNAITGFSDPPTYQQLTMAPFGLRERIISLIERETARAREGQRSFIRAKMNSLLDVPILVALYEASQAGVSIDLCVRGMCVLRPGLPGISENIRVISIVDRFLEHSRVFHFHNGGSDEVYLSSADWMPRNLDKRVELLFPVESTETRKKALQTLDIAFSDNVNAWELRPSGEYIRRRPGPGDETVRSQYALYELAKRQYEQHAREFHFQLRPIESREGRS
ncbi:MAG TPA: polyphosphate kinase 1 [Acidobacteriota bacterium]|jgi:polyphosphate kinase|nr:polyphosphate kinase 1 [Acidobacteriota bacterium]